MHIESNKDLKKMDVDCTNSGLRLKTERVFRSPEVLVPL